MRYATFDENGFATAFYAPEIFGPMQLPVYGPVPDPTDEEPNPVAPVIGETPNPAYPAGCVEITDEQWMELVSYPGQRQLVDGIVRPFVPVPPPTTLGDYTAAIAGMLDAKARTRRYDNALSIATYVGSGNAAWAAEAQAFVAWRDQIWAYCYAELAKVQAGEREQPTISDFLVELDTQFPLTWSE